MDPQVPRLEFIESEHCPDDGTFYFIRREQYLPDPVDTFFQQAAGRRGTARSNARVAALAEFFERTKTPRADSPGIFVEDRFRCWWHAPAERILRWLRKVALTARI